MKFVKFRYIPEAEVELTWTDIEAFLLYAEHHYDHKCKEQGKIGGLLWGFRSRFTALADEDVDLKKQIITVFLGADDLNLLMKIAQCDPILQSKARESFNLVNVEWTKRNVDRGFFQGETKLKKFPGRRRAKGRNKR